MTESVYAPPKSDLRTVAADSTDAFYVVSLTKMIVLFIATMGGYQLYWHYRNWRLVEQRALSEGGPDGDVWPVPRAVFSIFFIHSLFGKVKEYAVAHERPADFDTTLTATLIVVMSLFGLTGMFVKEPKLLLLLSAVSLILLTPIALLYRKAQRFINETCGDPMGASNSAFTAANYIWIVIGVLVWLMQLSGLVVLALAP